VMTALVIPRHLALFMVAFVQLHLWRIGGERLMPLEM